MSSVLKADVKEYIPSWANKRSSGVNPAATSTNKNGFATSVPTSNVMTTHSGCTGINAQNFTSSPRAAAGLPLCSPTTALRLPTRMSPMHAPFPSVSISMNPNATDFVPHLTGANSLAPLPTSTADLAEEKERQQKQESHLSSSMKWTTTSTRKNITQPALPLAVKANFTPTFAPIYVEKTEEEILEISKRSSLKVGAAAFVPRRTLNRVMIAKPSPFSLTPATGEMTLGDLWCLFYLPAGLGECIRENTYDPTLVFRVDSVATFWKVFNNIPQPTEMKIGTLYFFRDGINPKWEDPGNRDGGILKMKLDSHCINDAWVYLLCRTIGESWSKSVRDTVNGVALKARERAYLLEVWVTEQSAELMMDISELLRPLLGDVFSVFYAPHSVTQERAAAAALAEKKRSRNNRRRW
ncbi:Eukaryotic translation initiation factor 4E-4 [Trypanosoma cruzi]|uniref:Eukaryotic translation initiation factor 4E, putative n=2 Tax=Trypanosoma cruzi TaxID=5693 RepID=Q4CWW8_TRYCC|nr:eukaryotic translation initiation factor 4E, putative [Trypanosoma cruzi]EAN84771.1 eukaryotic translation initiation factor 4E, putative [Trypanosoma cruzi]PWV08555.1 Eukaryotic translation initiation factor 4E-4 [Trypanosoma cruzi]RNC49496.1 putative eukaryotic translation initiation factor 4e [Trypanosoma cruzi]|eukprot:XP_806622.1 eukaryotic translation initiation factor 4E [Trypanosoma cruzi strain CL Brener]